MKYIGTYREVFIMFVYLNSKIIREDSFFTIEFSSPPAWLSRILKQTIGYFDQSLFFPEQIDWKCCSCSCFTQYNWFSKTLHYLEEYFNYLNKRKKLKIRLGLVTLFSKIQDMKLYFLIYTRLTSASGRKVHKTSYDSMHNI